MKKTLFANVAFSEALDQNSQAIFTSLCTVSVSTYFPFELWIPFKDAQLQPPNLFFLSPLFAACHILECTEGLAQEVISTIGQAFELRFKQYLKTPPKLVTPHDRYVRTKTLNYMF